MLINNSGPLKKNTDTKVVSSSFKTQNLNSVLSKLYGLDVTDALEPSMVLDSVVLAPVPEILDTMTRSLELRSIEVSSSQFLNIQMEADTLTRSLSLTSIDITASQFHNIQTNDNDTLTRSLALTSITKQDILVIHHQHAVDTITRSLALTSITKS